MIGAGSVVFSKNLTGDILSYPEFRNATLSYMDIDAERLEVGADLCRKVAKTLEAAPTIQTTLNQRKALEGADFVINMVQIGGFNSTLVDFEIPRKYGLNFTIADTTGPGGLFRALRTYPMLKQLCADMMEICPRAILLNYSNPMSMNMQTIYRTSDVVGVGLCHSVQGTLNQIMGYIGENPADIAFTCAGINHMAFYLKLEKDGKDLYPRLFEAMKNPKHYATNKVRFELMRRLGYFVTESSEHSAEYCPYFIPHGKSFYQNYDVPIDEYLRRCDANIDEFDRMKALLHDEKSIEVHRSHEYGSTIIHSMATGRPSVVYGNMPNRGAIASLPDSAIAEAPTLVDRSGMHHAVVGELPPQLVAYMNPHVSQHELFIRAAMEGRRDHVYQAAMVDPLTAATLTLDQIVEMCDELIAAQSDLLPKLDAKKTLVPNSGKTFKPTDANDLRRSWDAAREKNDADPIRHWDVIGPFPSEGAEAAALETLTPLDELAARNGGAVDTAAPVKFNGHVFKWTSLEVNKKNALILNEAMEGDQGVGYIHGEVESVHPREAVLHWEGSGPMQLWINGKLVHTVRWKHGAVRNSEEIPAFFKDGTNHLLMKSVHCIGRHWSQTLLVPKANF
jgi:alpha-galactosidase